MKKKLDIGGASKFSTLKVMQTIFQTFYMNCRYEIRKYMDVYIKKEQSQSVYVRG